MLSVDSLSIVFSCVEFREASRRRKSKMPDEGLLRSVKRFDGTNFQAWKFQITAVLVASEIFDVVDGTRVRLENEEGANAGRTKTWIKDNAKATAIIALAMEAEQITSVIVCRSAKEMWDKLSAVHEQKSAANVGTLTQRFYSYKMGSTDSVIQHVSTVQNMARQLKDLGETVSDAAVIAKILSSLTAKYSVLKTAWDSVDPGRQTVSNLLERLIREENSLNEEDDSAGTLAVTKRGNPKSESYAKDEQKKKKPKSKRNIEYFRCQEKSHYASQCQQKKNQGDRDNKNNKGQSSSSCAFVVGSRETKSESVLTASSRSKQPSGGQIQRLLSVDRKDVWITDSGASAHITYRRDWIEDLRPLAGEKVTLGDDGECEVVGVGNVRIEKLVNGEWEPGIIEGVLLVPRVTRNLFSVGVCTAKGFCIGFVNGVVEVSRDGAVVATGVKQSNSLYRMFFRAPVVQREANVSSLDLKVWHERLGHIHKRALCDLVKRGVVDGISIRNAEKFFCEACQLGKLHKLPFRKEVEKRSKKPGEFIHSDVCGPVPVQSTGGARFYVLFKDDATSFRYVYFIRHKADVYDRFREFERLIHNKFGRTMSTLRTDNGKEYRNARITEYLTKRGITLETTAPYTPEQNGRAERDNRTIVESARTMLHAKQLSAHLWTEATATAVYTLNRTGQSHSGGSQTPFELWTGRKPNLGHMRVFGSDAYAYVPKLKTTKFEARAKKLILVGYDSESTNYRLYNPENKTVSVCRHVSFNEKSSGPGSAVPTSEVQAFVPLSGSDGEPEAIDNEGVAEADTKNGEDEAAVDNDEYEDAHEGEAAGLAEPELGATPRVLRNRAMLRLPRRYEVNLAECNIPSTYEEAVSCPEAAQWIKAIEDELQAHRENRTWELVQRVPGEKLIDSKWVFKMLRDTEGNALRFKARLCARGFLQRHGVDYSETFSPVVRYDSIRVLLAIIIEENLDVVQFDVRTAFLHGILEEDVRMEIPTGLRIDKEERRQESVVCKLKKSLYGLKQAPRCWNVKVASFLKQFNLRESDADKCVFCGVYSDCKVYLALFVDDGIIASKSPKVIADIVNTLREEFEITLGDCSYFIGIPIERDRERKSMFVHQTAYAKKIIEKFGMNDAKRVSVPADPHVVLYPVESIERDHNVPYREVVGSLMFLAIVTRPDIAYSVNLVSKFLNKHDKSHWRAVKRIISYLIGTVSMGIEYRTEGSKTKLEGYSDADFASDVETRRSTTGYAFCMAGGIVTWASQRQKLVSLSTTESEYVAAATASKEAVWLRILLTDIGYHCDESTVLYIDNQSAIRLVLNPEFHKRTKHIDVKYHYIREKVENREIRVAFVPTEAQLADVFTKALPRNRFFDLCTSLGMCAKRSDGGSVEVCRRI